MKGYETSTDYQLLWGLIQLGYVIPVTTGTHWLTISLRRGGLYYGLLRLENEMNECIAFFIKHQITFIPPTELSEAAKEKLRFILGHSTATGFPKVSPEKEWVGSVLDFLEMLVYYAGQKVE